MRHEWKTPGGTFFSVDSERLADRGPLSDEILRLAGRDGEHLARIAALEEENRRLRTEILSKNEELHELELEMREEYPE